MLQTLRLVAPQSWPAGSWVAVAAVVLTCLFAHATRRPAFAKGAPAVLAWADWPVVGALRFFSARHDFWHDAVRRSATGSFSFYIGRKQCVGVSGDEGRAMFFEHKGLSLAKA